MGAWRELSVAEDFLLLTWHDDKGKDTYTGSSRMLMAGAHVIDLALAELVTVEDGKLVTTAGAAPQDALHAHLLDQIRGDTKPRKVSKWMNRWGRDTQVRQAAPDRLAERGILRAEGRRIIGLFPVIRYPVADVAAANEVRGRVGDVLVSDDEPSPRDGALAGLAATGGSKLVTRLVGKSDRKAALQRGKRLAKEGVSSDVADAVQEAQAAAMAAITAAAAASSVSSASGSGS